MITHKTFKTDMNDMGRQLETVGCSRTQRECEVSADNLRHYGDPLARLTRVEYLQSTESRLRLWPQKCCIESSQAVEEIESREKEQVISHDRSKT